MEGTVAGETVLAEPLAERSINVKEPVIKKFPDWLLLNDQELTTCRKVNVQMVLCFFPFQ